MPEIDSRTVSLMASIATIFVQMVKGLIPEKAKPFIPLALFCIMVPLGIGLSVYAGTDPVAGALEGFFGFATAVGFYETASSVPGVKAVFNNRGWLRKQ